MKRQTLAARAEFLHQRQEQLARAAKEFAKTDEASLSSTSSRENARRNLLDAGIAYGLACKRYLGGREG